MVCVYKCVVCIFAHSSTQYAFIDSSSVRSLTSVFDLCWHGGDMSGGGCSGGGVI